MKPLIKQTPNGEWELPGVSFLDMPPQVYGALCKLLDYEKTNLAPQEIEEYKKAQPCFCTVCNKPMFANSKYCSHCGANQKTRKSVAEKEVQKLKQENAECREKLIIALDIKAKMEETE